MKSPRAARAVSMTAGFDPNRVGTNYQGLEEQRRNLGSGPVYTVALATEPTAEHQLAIAQKLAQDRATCARSLAALGVVMERAGHPVRVALARRRNGG